MVQRYDSSLEIYLFLFNNLMVSWARVMDPKDEMAMDCVAIVEMSSLEEANAALEGLHGTSLDAPMPPMRVRFAGKEQKPGANLYVAGLQMIVQENNFLKLQIQTGPSPKLLTHSCAPPSWIDTN